MGLKDLLTHFHKVKESESKALTDFLLPMLEIYPDKRATASQMLGHYWLDMNTTEFFVTEEEMKKNPHFYDKSIIDQDQFTHVINKEDFNADVSDMETEETNDDQNYY